MPILLPVGWYDVLALAIGIVLCVWVMGKIKRLKDTSGDGPWCPLCDYSLFGNPEATSCPECGTDLRDHKPVIAHPSMRRRWLTAWRIVVCFMIGAAVRFMPAGEGRFVDFRMTNNIDVDTQILKNPWDQSITEVYAWQGGFQWGVIWGWELIPFGPAHYDAIEMMYRNLGTAKYTKLMQIDPVTLDFDYPSAVNGQRISGQSLDVSDVLAWLADGGIDVTQPYTQSQADFVVKVIKGKAVGNYYREQPNDPMEVTYHTPVGSRHPRRSLWSYTLALLAIFVLIRWGRRQIRATAST